MKIVLFLKSTRTIRVLFHWSLIAESLISDLKNDVTAAWKLSTCTLKMHLLAGGETRVRITDLQTSKSDFSIFCFPVWFPLVIFDRVGKRELFTINLKYACLIIKTACLILLTRRKVCFRFEKFGKTMYLWRRILQRDVEEW